MDPKIRTIYGITVQANLVLSNLSVTYLYSASSFSHSTHRADISQYYLDSISMYFLSIRLCMYWYVGELCSTKGIAKYCLPKICIKNPIVYSPERKYRHPYYINTFEIGSL